MGTTGRSGVVGFEVGTGLCHLGCLHFEACRSCEAGTRLQAWLVTERDSLLK